MAPGSELKGCLNCYACACAARDLPGMRSPTSGKAFARRTANGPRWTGKVELIPSKLDEPLRWRKPCRVFVNSMSDLFHEALSDQDIERVFAVMGIAERHTFQVLTKRPERMRSFIGSRPRDGMKPERAVILTELGPRAGVHYSLPWPLPNVWLGVSVEDQATADERIPLLLQTPAAVRFVSYEPALGPVDFAQYLPDEQIGGVHLETWLDWIIYGGESGPGARPNNIAWARGTRDQCAAAGGAFFCKQFGADVRWNGVGGGSLPLWEAARAAVDTGDGDWRVPLKDRKGGDPAEWPEDLRVREFPQ